MLTLSISKIQGNNRTVVTEFFLIGFQGSQNVRLVMFCLLLMIYCWTVSVNTLLITLVSTSKNLHTPMYFFISQLFVNDILLTTDITPNMLHILLNNGGAITFSNCIIQLYLFSASEASECLLLTVMSYDRYMAICNPLHYISLMTNGNCLKLAIASWAVGFSIIWIGILTTSMQTFCGPNNIDHLFCDLVPLLDLSCSDTSIVQLEVSFLSLVLVIIPSIIIVTSYTNIIVNILRISSSSGRHKAFSTCSSHLIVVSIFYWTLFSVYVFPTRGQTSTISKILSLLYTVFTPLINPIIYTFRNKDIKKALQVQIHKSIIYFSST
ncbi:olfactory receptor 6B1-like [Eleutherodactylus coqui]|uniref:olfactory receptor 6B1-like n=1 Tax=Eleutherodactylus coqui TaxID=57060 RepID=UPI00346355BD